MSSKKPPLKIALCNKKGGVGKSTIARALAAALVLAGNRVLLVDGDATQWSSAAWFQRRRTELGERAAVIPAEGNRAAGVLHVRPAMAPSKESLSGEWDYIFFDTPGRDDAETRGVLIGADLVLVPVRPSHDDTDCLPATTELIRKAAQARGRPLPAYVVVNFLKKGTRAAEGIEELGSALGPGVAMFKSSLRDLTAITECRERGLCVLELARATPAAVEDLNNLVQEFLQVARHG